MGEYQEASGYTMICPCCIEIMNQEFRTLGGGLWWWVCPKCGLRIEYFYESEPFDYIDYIHLMNMTGGKHEMNK